MIKFDGIHITSKNPKRLGTFYSEVLGWKMLDDKPEFDNVRFAGRDDVEPVLWLWDENKHGKLNEGTFFLVFSCPDPDAMYQNLKQKGVVLDPPRMASWGGKELMVIDPDGNKLLMVE